MASNTLQQILEAHAAHYRNMSFGGQPKGTLPTEQALAAIESECQRREQALLDELERIAYTDTGEFTLVELRRLIRASKHKGVKGSN